MFLQSKPLVAALLLRMSRTVDEAVRRILACEPDVVGFTVYYTTWHMSVMLAKRLKEIDPGISIVLGGPEGSSFTDRIGRDELDAVDAVIPGEGEIPLLALLSDRPEEGGFKPCPGAHVKVDGRFVWSGESPAIQDLDSLPFPDFGAFDIGDYGNSRQLITYFSRGCFKKCVFCDGGNHWKTWRNRGAGRVVDEIEHLTSRHPEVDHFVFGDSLLNADMEGLLLFSRRMRERTAAGRIRPVEWRGYAVVRPDMTAEACREMKAAGCSELWFGIESGSQRVLDAMRKGYRTAAADAVLRNCREAGIRTAALLIAGFPTETTEDFDETLAFIRRNAGNLSAIHVGGGALILDGSPLRRAAFSDYGVEKETFHPVYWRSLDGRNDFPERVRRLDALCVRAREEGIPAEPFNREPVLAAYDKWRTAHG